MQLVSSNLKPFYYKSYKYKNHNDSFTINKVTSVISVILGCWFMHLQADVRTVALPQMAYFVQRERANAKNDSSHHEWELR